MTPDELRAKHHVGQNEAENQCQACYSADGYPCDVIKVLDALEFTDRLVSPAQTDTQEHPEIRASATSDVLPESECNSFVHVVPENVRKLDEVYYCPKCGEKL